MGHRNRFAWSAAVTAALALTLAVAPRAEAGHHGGGGGGGSHGGGGGGGSHSGGGSHGGGGSTSHSTSGGHSTSHTTTTGPSRSGGSGHYSGGGHSSGGHYTGGGHYHGGGHYYGGHHYGGSHYGHSHGGYGWYPNYYWGFWPFYASFGWWWGSPWYGDWTDWRFANGYASGPSYGDVYAWRSGGWPSHFGRVKTDVEPDEAQLLLNGKYLGTADDFDGYPDYIYFEPGTYHLEFQLPGYQTFASDVTVRRGETVRVNHRLEKEPGQPRLGGFLPESKGVPSGRYFGKDGNPVSPNAHHARAKVAKSDSDDEAPADVDVRSGGSDGDDADSDDGEEMRAPEPPHPAPPPAATSARGRLRWTVTPDDAAIWVDDEYIGTGEELSARPRGTVLGAGRHTVTIVRPGYRTRTVEVEVAAGESKDLVVELEK